VESKTEVQIRTKAKEAGPPIDAVQFLGDPKVDSRIF